MEIPKEIQKLGSQFSLTEPSEYILTKEEEEISIRHEIESLKHFFQWRRLEIGQPLGSIEAEISGIDWVDKINREQLLQKANSNKHHKIWEQEQRQSDRENELKAQEELKKYWDAKVFYRLMAATSEELYGKKLIVNNNTTKLIKTVCFFMAKDNRLDTELGYSLNKGLLIRGTTGIGKTHIVKCVKSNQIRPITILSMVEITEEIKSTGEFVMKPYRYLYLDDVGTEETKVIHYGTTNRFFKEFIESVYFKQQDFSNIIISTNNNFAQLEEKYGFRVRSRMAEMFNVVDVGGVDMRKI